jgi:hypothetical protein
MENKKKVETEKKAIVKIIQSSLDEGEKLPILAELSTSNGAQMI